MYQTLDAIDGKQARRTGTSSPLGELFDHGAPVLCFFFLFLNVFFLVSNSQDAMRFQLGFATVETISLF
jgi:phosphatidylglycerophosphate synthase